jgi:catechol 2,3-dioxygenase-like lactoylglutathione lyase family enzyme
MKPNPTLGLRHIALYIKNFEACRHFYIDILGMKIAWQPDENNLYLTSGTDNLALHRASLNFQPSSDQCLDHLGFFLAKYQDVDTWHQYLLSHHVVIKAPPKDHRDHTRSFYCADPDGNTIQFIYYPLEKL